jgi:hypothetical protein
VHNYVFLLTTILWWFVYIVNKLFSVPLLSPEGKVAKCQRLVSMAPRVIVGNFDGLDFASTEEFLTELRQSIKSLESAVVNPFLATNTRLDVVLSRARDVDTRITLGCRTDFVRKQPFGILVAGPPGSGKTFGSQNLAIRLYNLNHEKPATKQDIVVLNEGDEFQSEFRSCHRIVLFDDLGATKTSVVATDPFRKIIDFINNVPKTALNPHLDLKGNVWINPDIVVATTNLFIPFSSGNNVNNTEVIQCVAAINRRFPVKIWQQGFDEFYIVDNRDTKLGHKRDDGSHYKFHYTRLNSEQLYERVKEIYLEHCESQEKFVEMVEDQVRPEGLYGTALKFAAITSLQAIARLTISLEARDGDEGLAALLVALRRFVATPLQALKRSSQAELTTRLIAAGLSKDDTHRYKSTLEKLCKFGPVLYRAHVTEQDLLELRVVIDMIAPVIEQAALKTIVRPLPYELCSIVYDSLSLLFPKVTKLIMEKVPSVTLKSLQLTKSVSAEGELRSKTLKKIYDLDWILAMLELYEIQEFRTIELYVGSFILDGYRVISKKPQPIIASGYTDRPSGACLTEKEFRLLVESDEIVRPEGASGPCTVQLSEDESKESLNVNVRKNDYRLLLPVRTVVEPRQVVADFLARRIDLSSMMLRMGAARRKNLLILRRVDYVNKQFLQGIYTLAYDEVHSTLLIFRTVKKTYKVNLSYWFDLLKFAARENSVVFCGRNENVTLVTPLFSDKFCPVEEALGTVLSVNELCIDIMGRSARRKNESQFLVGKATRGEDSKPLPNMMEDERRRLAKLCGTEWTS